MGVIDPKLAELINAAVRAGCFAKDAEQHPDDYLAADAANLKAEYDAAREEMLAYVRQMVKGGA